MRSILKTRIHVLYQADIKALYWLIFGSASQRRRVRQECARLVAGIFGDYPISEDYKLWRIDSEFLTDYRRLSPLNPYSQDRKYVLREFARYTRDVPGVMAERGCYQGASAYFLAKERPQTPLHLFDSFEGLPSTGIEDTPVSRRHRQWHKGDLRAPEHVVRDTLKEFRSFEVHKGWIPDRFPDVEHLHFSLVHIDVDLYEPTLAALRFFYPRMNPGGAMILDDYGFTSCPGAYRAAREFMADKPEYVLHLPTGQGVILIGRHWH